MRKIAYQAKEELYDVIAALSAVIRELTEEIIESHSIMLESNKQERLLISNINFLERKIERATNLLELFQTDPKFFLQEE
jgi:hypothetical protein